jgi:hypothetical protein
MFRPYSLDLRERAVALLDEGVTSIEVAQRLRVSDSWVRKMRLRRAFLCHLNPTPLTGDGHPIGSEHDVFEDVARRAGVESRYVCPIDR